MSIAILAAHTEDNKNKYFAAYNLSLALNATLYNVNERLIKEDNLIIIGMRGLEHYKKIRNTIFKTKAVIFSDTNFCRYYKWCNEYVSEHNIFVYAMPDLHDFLFCKYVPAYQTITIPDIIIKKPDDRIVICHSPGTIKGKFNYKGTNQINEVVEKLSKKYVIEYKLLQGFSHEKCIKEKSTAHIFIDQIIKNNPFVDQNRFGNQIIYKGGLGKSGIEGMLLNCCVITSMDHPNTEPYFPPPPIIMTDYRDFELDLERAVCDINYRNKLVKKQKIWADKYCGPEFVSMNVTRHINGTANTP